MRIEIKDNAVLKDGEQIGTIFNGILFSPKPIAGPVKGKIRLAAGNPDMPFVVGEADNQGLEDALKNAAGLPATPKPSTEPQTIADLLELAKAGKIPQPPPQRHDAGDKTPAFISWVKANVSAEEFQRLYGHRKYTMDENEIDKGNEAHRVRLTKMEQNKNLSLA